MIGRYYIVFSKENIKKFPDKEEFYTAEFAKQLSHQGVLATDGVKIKALKLSAVQSETWEEEVKKRMKSLVQECIKTHTDLLFMSMKKLRMRKDELGSHSEMSRFQELTVSFEVLVKDILGVGNLDGMTKEQRQEVHEKIQQNPDFFTDYFDAELILLSEYIMYLGYNNSNREANSKQLKNEIDKICKQALYVQQNTDLKNKGHIPQNQDSTISYLKGMIQLEETDQEQIRAILKRYGNEGVGRTM